jgi:proline iminopeptidase
LHGGPGLTHFYFECFEAFLPQAGIRFWYYDQLGCGFSDQPNDPRLWNLERFTAEVEEVRAGLRLCRMVLYGHSWDGMLAIEYALIRYPNSISHLVLICTAALSRVFGDPDCIYNPGHPLHAQVKAARLRSQEMNDDGAHWLRVITYFSLYNKALTDSLLKRQRISQQRADVIREEVLANWSLPDQPATIKVPTIVIAGRHDVQSPLIASYLMVKDIPDSELAICSYSGYHSHKDEPERFAGIIADFFSQRLGSM